MSQLSTTTQGVADWEKMAGASSQSKRREFPKFLIGGVLLLVAVGYLIISGTMGGARYFMTVDELVSDPQYVGQKVRITGAVIGESIVYDSENLIIQFTIANVEDNPTDLALALHNAVSDPTIARLPVYIEGEVKPDLLQHEAQAILSGELRADGTFYASELLLKCPSRYEESVPAQVQAEPGV